VQAPTPWRRAAAPAGDDARRRGAPTALGADVEAAHARYAESHDARLEAELLHRHEALAVQLANRFVNRGEPAEDLRQVALLALLRAIRNYDPGRGARFSTYATPVILGALKRHLRDRGWLVRPPRRVQEVYLAANAAIEDLHKRLGREPIAVEIAEHTGLPLREVVRGLNASGARHATPLPMPGLHGLEPTDDLAERDLGSPVSRSDDRCFLDELLRTLSNGQRQVLALSFFADLTQSQIAARLGVSQSTVCRLRRQALRQLRMVCSQSTTAA
jgi:RNA polymerase sigma-B factor